MKERDELVGRLEKPGWGMGLWSLLKPAIPALSLGAQSYGRRFSFKN